MEDPGETLEAVADGRRNHHWPREGPDPAHTHFRLLEAKRSRYRMLEVEKDVTEQSESKMEM